MNIENIDIGCVYWVYDINQSWDYWYEDGNITNQPFEIMVTNIGSRHGAITAKSKDGSKTYLLSSYNLYPNKKAALHQRSLRILNEITRLNQELELY